MKGCSTMMSPLGDSRGAVGLAARWDDIDQPEVYAWLAELKALDAGGAYSFAVLQSCFTATRPAIPQS
jgi:hypothetical protein